MTAAPTPKAASAHVPVPAGARRPGFVLSGGGAYAAYEVGVMRALIAGASPASDYLPIEADVISGTSGGSVNAAIVACAGWGDAGEAVDELERLWVTRLAEQPGACGSSVLRLRANPLNWLNPACVSQGPAFYASFFEDLAHLAAETAVRGQMFLTSPTSLRQRLIESFDLGAIITGQPLRELLAEIIDVDRVRASPRALRIAATNWRTGELRVFRNADFVGTMGIEVLLASSAIPGIFPSVEIDDEPFVDGGVVMNTPLKPAIQAGANELHVIYMDPDVIHVALPRLRNTLNTIYRMLVISFGLTVSRDIRTAAAINLRLRQDLEAATTTALTGEPRATPYKPLIVHRYHPHEDLGGTFRWLDFDRQHVTQLIAQGYEDAVAHDCVRNRCVIEGQEEKIVKADTAEWVRRDA